MSRKAYGIYCWEASPSPKGTEVFMDLFALTEFEARKYCLDAARERMASLGWVNAATTKPLWYGEKPASDGLFLLYGLPGPNETQVDVVRYYMTPKGWLTSSTQASEVLASYRYKVMNRVPENLALQTSVTTVTTSEGVTKVRDLNKPHEALLSAIETHTWKKGEAAQSPSMAKLVAEAVPQDFPSDA